MLKMKAINEKLEISFDQPNLIRVDHQLDNELHQIVNSFNFALNLCFSSKYYVQNNRIEARGIKYRLLTSCYTIIMGLLCICRIITADIRDALMSYSENCFLRFLSGLYYTDYLLGFILCYILDIVHSHNHIILVSIFKVINRSIDCSKIVSRFIVWNWITLCTTICIDLFIYVMYYGFFARFSLIENISDCLCDVMFITFYINYIIAIRVIILLKVYLDEWILNIRNLSNGLDGDEVCLKLIRVYNDIMKAYDLYKSIYQLLTATHVLDTFLRSLTFFYLIIINLKKNALVGDMVSPMYVIDLIVWMSKSVALVIIYSIYCERFYITVEEAESACMQLVMNRNCPKSHNRLCKAVIRINRSFSKMSACGLFYIDAALAIGLMGAVTNYAVVLLQFVIL